MATARLHGSTTRSANSLRQLVEITRAFAEATPDLTSLVELIVERTSELVGGSCVLALVSDEGETLLPVASFDRDPGMAEMLRGLADGGPMAIDATELPEARALRSGRVVFERDVDPAPSSSRLRPHDRAAFVALGPMSLLVVPMRAYGRPVGTLSITWRGAGREAPDAEVVALVEALAGHACFALANARQFATGRALRYQAGRAGEAQRTAEARFHQLIATTGESVWMLDGEQRITFANGRTAMLLGHDDPSELIGLHRDTFVFPEDRAAAAGRHAVRRAGVSGRDETRLRRRDGSEVWVLIEATPLHDADGRFEGVLAMAMDVTERRCGQEALRASEERFRELAESIREVFWLSDVVGRQMIYVSPAYEVIWGRPCTPVQAVPREWAASLHPDDRERVVRASRALHLAGDYDLEYRIVRPDGAVRWIHDKAFPVRDASGRVVRVAGVAEDVTERRELEAQFRQAQKMEAVGRLAGGVAHDFNNVLSVISGYADLVSGDLLPGDPMFEDVGQIQRAAARAAGLTRHLLAFSRQQVLEPRALDLAEVVLDMEKLMLRLLGEDIVLSLAATPGAGRCVADPGQVEQVIMNLVVNARDAMPDGGRLTIATSAMELDEDFAGRHIDLAPGAYVALSVADSGLGMDEATRARIFEPFFTTKAKGKGTGLGLSTVFGIVKQSGGHVWVESEAGRGAKFTVCFPREVSLGSPETVASPAALPGRGSETVLVVEDEPLVREVVCGILLRSGYHVLDAANAGEALLICEQHGADIDLLLTDVVMPRMNGPQLASRLAPLRPGMRVLYVSGYTENSVVSEGAPEAGAAYLSKPITPVTLLGKVREVLDAPAPTRRSSAPRPMGQSPGGAPGLEVSARASARR
ncbi:MAG: PAS domain S-box protein [Deltaproteobacteria bacterium]|nr:PAS domain S-box protein [Myxococcales bacterium]MDP3212887.1 PAS domain S-box protein [Deltaproteobacteria bacterium]